MFGLIKGQWAGNTTQLQALDAATSGTATAVISFPTFSGISGSSDGTVVGSGVRSGYSMSLRWFTSVMPDLPLPGEGWWVRLSGPDSVFVLGSPVNAWIVPAVASWNRPQIDLGVFDLPNLQLDFSLDGVNVLASFPAMMRASILPP